MKHHLSLSRRRRSDEGKRRKNKKKLKKFSKQQHRDMKSSSSQNSESEQTSERQRWEEHKSECQSIMDGCELMLKWKFRMSTLVIEFLTFLLFVAVDVYSIGLIIFWSHSNRRFYLYVGKIINYDFLLFYYFLMMKNISMLFEWFRRWIICERMDVEHLFKKFQHNLWILL